MILNIPFFACGTILNWILALLPRSNTRPLHLGIFDHLSVGLLLVEAARDITAVSAIFCMYLVNFFDDVVLMSG